MREEALPAGFAERVEVLLVVRPPAGVVVPSRSTTWAVMRGPWKGSSARRWSPRCRSRRRWRTAGRAAAQLIDHEPTAPLAKLMVAKKVSSVSMSHQVVALPAPGARSRCQHAAVAGLDVAVEVADGVAEVGPAVHHRAATTHGDVVPPDPLRALRAPPASAGPDRRRCRAPPLRAAVWTRLGVEGGGRAERAALVEQPAGGAGARACAGCSPPWPAACRCARQAAISCCEARSVTPMGFSICTCTPASRQATPTVWCRKCGVQTSAASSCSSWRSCVTSV